MASRSAITNTRSNAPARHRVAAVLFVIAALAAACGSAGNDTINLGTDPLAPDVESGEVETSASGDVIDFTYETFDGDTVAFADLPDGPVVLNFFASWCPTCVSELPEFEAVSQDLEDEVTFLGLATSERPESAIELVAETGITFATGSDASGEIYQIFEGIGMPTTVFLDADHRVVRVHSGVLTAESLTDTINSDLLS